MEKKYFQTSFILAIVFFLGVVACSMLLIFGVKTPINLKSLGSASLYSWLIFFVMAIVFGAMHFFKKKTWPV